MKNNKNLQIEDEESENNQETTYLESSLFAGVNTTIEDLIQSSKAQQVVKANQNQNYSVPKGPRGTRKQPIVINPPSIVNKPEKDETLVIESTQSLLKQIN